MLIMSGSAEVTTREILQILLLVILICWAEHVSFINTSSCGDF